MFKSELVAVDDIRADPGLYSACEVFSASLSARSAGALHADHGVLCLRQAHQMLGCHM